MTSGVWLVNPVNSIMPEHVPFALLVLGRLHTMQHLALFAPQIRILVLLVLPPIARVSLVAQVWEHLLDPHRVLAVPATL